MFKIIVLVSGSGTNMLQLIKNDIKIDCIIADRECKAKNIADEYIDFSSHSCYPRRNSLYWRSKYEYRILT